MRRSIPDQGWRHKDRIRRFSESRVECALLQIVVQNREKSQGMATSDILPSDYDRKG